MKKVLPAFLTLLAVVVGGAAVYFYQRPAFQGAAVRPMTADYLPADALLLLVLPDPAETLADWKTTDLYKIWCEPEVQAFLEKPLSQIPQSKEFTDILASVQKIDPKNLFVTLTSLEEKTNKPHLLAGFQFKGSPKDIEQVLAAPKEALKRNNPQGKADLINYQGRSIETYTDNDGDVLAAVFLEDWYLISNDLPLLKATIDRVEHRAPANQPTLANDADFKSVCAKMPAGSETLIFARAQPFLTRIYAFAAASGQPVSPTQRAEAEKIKAIGASTRIENGKIRDTIYYLAPGLSQETAKLGRSSLPLTSANTVFYAAAMLDIPAKFDLPDAPSSSAAMALLGGYFEEFTKRGITLESFHAAFSNETSTQLDWPNGAPYPSLIASLAVRNRGAAETFLSNLATVPTGETASWRKTQTEGQSYYTMTLPSVTFINPTLTLNDQHLILALNAPDARAAFERDKAGGGAIAQSENYKSAAALVGKPNVAFAYLDAKAFFERFYGGTVRPLAMSAALFAPQIGNYIDLGKLPNTEPIAKHLSPVVYSQVLDNDGLTLESTGTITFGQALVGFGAGVGAVAVPILQKQYGFTPGQSAPAPSPDDAEGTPTGTPKPTPTPAANE